MNLNARTFLGKSKKGRFLKADELRSDGPLRFTVAEVEVVEGFKGRDGNPRQEIVLISTAGEKFSLRTDANLRMMLSLFGDYTDSWMGRTFELYFDPTVVNPSGG